MIHILQRKCEYCKKKLLVNTTWYFQNDYVFCSKICRKNYIMYVNDKMYLGVIHL